MEDCSTENKKKKSTCSPFGISEIKSVNNNPWKRWKVKQEYLVQPSPTFVVIPAASPFPSQLQMFSPLHFTCKHTKQLFLHLSLAQTPTGETTTSPLSAAAWTASAARRSTGEAGQGGTACSTARWKRQAKLWGTGAPLLHVKFSGEQFDWRCSTTFSGMCKQSRKSLRSRQVFLGMA